MKKLHFIGLFITLMIVTGCTNNSVEPAYYIYATIENKSFKYEGSTYLASSSGSYKSTFIVAAYPDDETSLLFTTATPLTKSPATLNINFAAYSNNSNESYIGSSGSCSVTKFDGSVVEGTFYFDAYDTVSSKKISVKEGRFRLKYN